MNEELKGNSEDEIEGIYKSLLDSKEFMKFLHGISQLYKVLELQSQNVEVAGMYDSQFSIDFEALQEKIQT